MNTTADENMNKRIEELSNVQWERIQFLLTLARTNNSEMVLMEGWFRVGFTHGYLQGKEDAR